MVDRRPQVVSAVLVGVQLPEVTEAEFLSSLAELQRLVETLGHRTVGRVTQRRNKLAPGVVLGDGKLRVLARWTGGTGVVPSGATVKKRKIDRDDAAEGDPAAPDPQALEAAQADALAAPLDGPDSADGVDEDDGAEGEEEVGEKATLVVVDHEMTPTQLRNLQRATEAEVIDRTGVILEIFHRHARSREARLQVEIARLGYLAPQLRETGGGDRQRGGIGGKGAGESSIELDRRKIRDRIAELKRELDAIAHEQDVRRARRQESLRVALVGYTNAGKSSLMRALTGSEVYVADKLFATLDTTVRPLFPESNPRILVSDTVGFIKKLPHDLVASFRSTLDEAREASLLLHVVDASDPAWRAQYEVTRQVLGEIDAGDIARRLVLNKCDRLSPEEREMLSVEEPDAWQVSAVDKESVARLRDTIVAAFEATMPELSYRITHAQARFIGELHSAGRVVSETWDDEGASFVIRAPAAAHARLGALLAS